MMAQQMERQYKLVEYAYIDKRIEIITQNNMGVSEARNNGIKKEANGKYICFVDSDDYIDEKMIEKVTYSYRGK